MRQSIFLGGLLVSSALVAPAAFAQAPAPQPVPVEPAFQPSPPAIAEQKVFVVENNVESAARSVDEIGAASDNVSITVAEIPRQPRRSFTEMLGTFMEEDFATVKA